MKNFMQAAIKNFCLPTSICLCPPWAKFGHHHRLKQRRCTSCLGYSRSYSGQHGRRSAGSRGRGPPSPVEGGRIHITIKGSWGSCPQKSRGTHDMTARKTMGNTSVKKVPSTGLISDLDCYLFGAGTHYDIYQKLGAHPTVLQGQKGILFCSLGSSRPRSPPGWRF